MASLRNIIELVDSKIAELKNLLPLKPEDQQRLDKKFRLEFNYNSNHLEGNTLTYGETELLILFDKTTGDHDYREYEEMTGHDVALKMIYDEADDERPLTEQFIRLLNERLLVRPYWKNAITKDGQQTRKEIMPGQYKTLPNSVRLQNGEEFEYTSPTDTPIEMRQLVKWYNENSTKEHPLLLAALLHYRFVRIHPFDDGNGRVARLLMNYVLLTNKIPLVVIKSNEKKSYLFALNRADTGDAEAFVTYLGEQLIWSLDLTLKAAKGEDIEEPEDLDKKIAVLSKKIKNNKASIQKISFDVLNPLLKDCIFPMIDKLRLTIEKFLEFYDKAVLNFSWDGGSPYADFQKFKDEMYASKINRQLLTKSIKMEYFLKGFKPDLTKNYSLFGAIEINFDEYRYSVKPSNSLEKYYSYDDILTTTEIDQITKQFGNQLYEDTLSKIQTVKNN